MRSLRKAVFLSLIITGGLGTVLLGQQNGIPASDILGSWDFWGNPTVTGGVANGGANSHGVW